MTFLSTVTDEEETNNRLNNSVPRNTMVIMGRQLACMLMSISRS